MSPSTRPTDCRQATRPSRASPTQQQSVSQSAVKVSERVNECGWIINSAIYTQSYTITSTPTHYNTYTHLTRTPSLTYIHTNIHTLSTEQKKCCSRMGNAFLSPKSNLDLSYSLMSVFSGSRPIACAHSFAKPVYGIGQGRNG